ncbi:AAA family ATPase [Crossiella sp. CA-258035]|uniref:ATP-binding protein n=1 Tax=Crossiella sp. CA-258035 TaxID=2981138 RepID=UPI0024BC1B6B|nr:LuxR family transcriptional regulator [Crossiella sp. CA-258035]WHT16859.1 AAA family ATPase [Crossiella sp. CA-258035]
MELWDRGDETALLAEEAERARGGQLRVVVVEGPAGIGRTSLLDEFVADVRSATVLRARGTELQRRFAFGVVRQLFSPLLCRLPEDRREALLAGGAEPVRQVLAGAEPGPDVVALENAPFAVLHGLYRLAATLTRERPLVLVLDDADLADAPSLRWLRYMRTRLAEAPVLLVLTRRTDGPAEAEDVLGSLVTDPDCVLIRPRLLSPAAVARMLPESADPALARACHQISGGNPLMVRTLLASMSIGDSPLERAGSLTGQVFAHSLGSWLTRLPAATVAFARALSVLGEAASAELPARLAGITGPEGRAAEDHLWQAGLLRCDPVLRWNHPAVREAVYTELAGEERARLHHAAATALHDASAPLEEVCAHLLLVPPAGDSWVLGTLCAAAAQAARRGAPDGAAEYLRRALAEPPPAEARTGIVVGLGMAEAFSNPAAGVDRLLEVFDEVTDPRLKAAMAEVLSDALARLTRHDEAIAMLARAAEDVAPLDPDLANTLTGRRLIVSISEQEGPARVKRPGADLPGDTAGERCLLSALAFASGMGGDPVAEAARLAGLAIPRTTAELTSPLAGPVSLVLTWTEQLDEAVRLCDKAIAESRRTHALLSLALLLSHRAQLAQFTGALSAALSYAESALEMLPLEQWGYLGTVPVAVQSDLLIELNEPELARRRMIAAELEHTCDQGFAGAFYQTVRARVRMACGEPAEGLADLLTAADHLREFGYENPVMLPWRVWAVEALHAQGHHAKAAEIAAQALASAHRWGTPRGLGTALRLTGLTRRGPEGEANLRESVELLSGITAPLELAASLLTLGELRIETEDIRGARTALRRCLEEAERCGAARLAELARERLVATGARPKQTPAAGTAALSSGERRVAELAAGGLSNRRIAEELHLTMRTVETHLSATYRKLGIPNRTALRALLGPGGG